MKNSGRWSQKDLSASRESTDGFFGRTPV